MMFRFPDALRQLRIHRGILQKTIAHHLHLDPGQLCAVEKGKRGPLDPGMLEQVAELLRLTTTEHHELAWSAHHDRLVILLSQRGASNQEVELVSASLEAYHHLQDSHRAALINSIRKYGDSAKLLSNLATVETSVEVMS
jgi:transcriptional regulator with XRE-family HTH domain